MKVSYKHLIKHIPSNPSIEDISKKFFQLGHEHEIDGEIFQMEITPNRGDCLSLHGLLRDLAVFYKIDFKRDVYKHDIKPFNLAFVNKAKEACSNISFLKIEIDGKTTSYKGDLKEYFEDLDISKNNFFTDISNYISYEKGQPTHCYDAKKIGDSFSLEIIKEDKKFETLQDKQITLKGSNLVFLKDDEVINLAGIMGGKSTSCSFTTKSAIIECAHFNSEEIIGKSVQYDINSEAAHKFERGVDYSCHEDVLRRFIKIVSDHANIKNIEIYTCTSKEKAIKKIAADFEKINNILGTSIDKETIKDSLQKLGFKIQSDNIYVPSHRNDVSTINDIAEEIARIIGYNNISAETFSIPAVNKYDENTIFEKNLKDFFVQHGFSEVINNPFMNIKEDLSVRVDNPLDSNRSYIRTSLKNSLINNLLYNERRQQDSIKLFEISDIYYIDKEIKNKKVLGIICSGRIGKNYIDFSKKIDINYLKKIITELSLDFNEEPILIDRKNLDTKLKNEIIYLEIDLNSLKTFTAQSNINHPVHSREQTFIKYDPISEYPSSTRDLSFSIKDLKNYYEIQNYLLNYKSDLIKEIFIFDYYNNHKNNEIKLGFRIIFQSKVSTITENEINNVMDIIINHALSFDSVSIPGLIQN